MGLVTKLLVFLFIGAIIGDVATMAVAPSAITWYATTPDPSALCNCLSTARTTAHQLIQAQAIGAGLGAVLCLALGIIVLRSRRKRTPPQEKPPTPTPM